METSPIIGARSLRGFDRDSARHAKLLGEQVAEIKEVLKNHAAKKLVWGLTPIEENIEVVKTGLGLESVVFSPCD